MHLAGGGTLVVNKNHQLLTIDCATWKLNPVTTTSATGPSHSLSDQGLVVISPPTVTFLTPTLAVERTVTFMAAGEAGPIQSTVDAQDNVWLLRDAECGLPSTLTVVSRTGQVASAVLGDTGWATTGRDCASITTAVPAYSAVLASTPEGAYLVESAPSFSDIQNWTAGQTAYAQCEGLCPRWFVGANRCAGFTTLKFAALDQPEHCPGVCLAVLGAAYRTCLGSAGDCAQAQACTDNAQPGHPFNAFWLTRLVLQAGPSIGFEFKAALSRYSRLGGVYRTRFLVGTEGGVATRSSARSGLLTYLRHHELRSGGNHLSEGAVESWNPDLRTPLMRTGEISTTGGFLELKYASVTPDRAYWYLLNTGASSIGPVTGSSALVVSERAQVSTTANRLQGLPRVQGVPLVHSPTTGDYYAVIEDSGGAVHVQRFDESGKPVAGPGSTTQPPRCSGSKVFTRLGDACWLDAVLDPGYRCASNSTSQTGYKCDAATCTFVGKVCGTCPDSACQGCYTGTCP
jgi:hypothetical protein